MEPVDLSTLEPMALIVLMRRLQNEFDSCKDGPTLQHILNEHLRIYGDLKRRGFSELQIEWMLEGKNHA